MYEQNILVKYSEMDHNFALKPYSLLNFLQDIASDNAEDLGFGYSFMSSHNYAWFLIKYRMEFSDYPVNVQNLKIKTTPRGYNKLFAYREFELLENDKSLGKAFSMWSIVDTNTRTTIPVGSAISNNINMPPYEKRETDLVFSKIKPSNTVDSSKDFEVRYNDIDVNGHANNGNYIVWAFEPLSLEFKTNHKIKTLDMLFKKELKYGDKIIVDVQFMDENTTVHTIKNNLGDEVCLIQCSWIKI